MPNYEASSWFGIAAPAGTPPAVVARLHGAIAAAVRTPAMQERFSKSGARLIGDNPQEFAARIARRAEDLGRDHQGGEDHAAVAWYFGPEAYSPGALAWIASAWTPPASSTASIWLIMRWRSTRLFPRNASDTI